MAKKIITLTFVWTCIGLFLIGGCATRLSVTKVKVPYDEIKINSVEDVDSLSNNGDRNER